MNIGSCYDWTLGLQMREACIRKSHSLLRRNEKVRISSCSYIHEKWNRTCKHQTSFCKGKNNQSEITEIELAGCHPNFLWTCIQGCLQLYSRSKFYAWAHEWKILVLPKLTQLPTRRCCAQSRSPSPRWCRQVHWKRFDEISTWRQKKRNCISPWSSLAWQKWKAQYWLTPKAVKNLPHVSWKLFSLDTNNQAHPGGRFEPSSPITNDLHYLSHKGNCSHFCHANAFPGGLRLSQVFCYILL